MGNGILNVSFTRAATAATLIVSRPAGLSLKLNWRVFVQRFYDEVRQTFQNVRRAGFAFATTTVGKLCHLPVHVRYDGLEARRTGE